MRVRSTDGVALAVYEHGDPALPTVVAMHGYPDNHSVWDGVVTILAERFHVITYDGRGSGESDKPRRRDAYRLAQLVDDLGAVLDAVSPVRPVHLLAHDWGSIQAWPAVCDPRFAIRVSSFASISGPSLDHAGQWLRDAGRHPGATGRQLLDSSYIALFHIPGLAETMWRSGRLDRLMALSGKLGRSSAAVDGQPHRGAAEKINGLELYRANMLRHIGRPRPGRTDVPVQVLAPADDIFVSVALQTQAPEPYATNLRTCIIPGGHWVVSDRPDVIARLTSEFVEFVEGGAETRALARARQRRHGSFAGRLVVLTGGARGIGRASALEFARHGADVIIADVNDVAAKETVALAQALGVDAAGYHLDVCDAEGWERFAGKVRDEHGVADVIVNNAGIGMAGPFLGTTVADWEKIIGVNLWGVIHGSRLFAAQMVQRGEGGHVVNIASAAAYSPSRIYPAYATTKAAVLMLTECLRAELGKEGIGVTAICPGFIDTDISSTTVHVGVDESTPAVAARARRRLLRAAQLHPGAGGEARRARRRPQQAGGRDHRGVQAASRDQPLRAAARPPGREGRSQQAVSAQATPTPRSSAVSSSSR